MRFKFGKSVLLAAFLTTVAPAVMAHACTEKQLRVELKALLADQEALAEIVQGISVALEPLWREEQQALKQLINAKRMIDETESEVSALIKEALEADVEARVSVKSSIDMLKRALEE